MDELVAVRYDPLRTPRPSDVLGVLSARNVPAHSVGLSSARGLYAAFLSETVTTVLPTRQDGRTALSALNFSHCFVADPRRATARGA